MAQLTEHDVINMRFNDAKRAEDGFDKDQVDYFLDEVAETIGALTKEKQELEAQLQTAQARVTELENQLGLAQPQGDQRDPSEAASTAALAPVDGQPQGTEEAENATSMLSLAQRLHDEYVADGRAEQERIISEANAESARIITEAEDMHNRTLTKLEEERSLLERKISELREFERDYRTRLRSYLESLLQNVESQNQQ